VILIRISSRRVGTAHQLGFQVSQRLFAFAFAKRLPEQKRLPAQKRSRRVTAASGAKSAYAD
jgi:hypothetical protein